MKNEVRKTENQSEIELLKASISEFQYSLTALKAENSALADDNRELRNQNKLLEEQIKLWKHRFFGPKSEKTKVDPDQITMFFNETEAITENDKSDPEPEPELIEVEQHYRKRTRLPNDKLPDNLPVEIVEHDIPKAERVCPCCGDPLHKVSADERRTLVTIPTQYKIRCDVRPVYACRNCEKTSDESVPFLKAELPEPVISGGFASPESVAHIIDQKYVLAVPLYRQEQELNRNGIKLSRQTMSNWIINATGNWLKPIYSALVKLIITMEVLHADETTMQVLHEDGKPAQSKSYMWEYRTSGDVNDAIVLFEYKPSRSHVHPEAFLKGFTGYLHADGYDGYHDLPDNIIIVGCWAHMRRKFDEVLKPLSKDEQEGTIALRGMQYCNRLFVLERMYATLSPEERLLRRQTEAKTVAQEFFSWAEASYQTVIPKSSTGKALFYAINQRKYLEQYLSDPRLEISNNRAERGIRPFAIGRKNWLFCNTKGGADTSAVIYSLIETAKENGLHPYNYLTWVFERAPNGAKVSELLPFRSVVPESVRLPLKTPEKAAWDIDT